MTKKLILTILVYFCASIIPQSSFSSHEQPNNLIGKTRIDLFSVYSKKDERTYRKDGDEEWITFYYNIYGGDSMLSVHLEENIVIGFAVNDREEIVREYMSEFVSQAFHAMTPGIYKAIKNVLLKIPQDAFMYVTDRAHPVIFTEVYNKGLGRYANSGEVWNAEDDPPTFTEGIWILKLSTELEEGSTGAIEGIIAHELAHFVLGHGRKDYSEKAEREANALIINWGFSEQFESACREFGE